MPTMSSLPRSRNSILSRSVSSPPKTRCSNWPLGAWSDMALSLEQSRLPCPSRAGRGNKEGYLCELGQPIAEETEQYRMTGPSGGHQHAMNQVGPIVG